MNFDEITLSLEEFTPETLPMDRLVKYLDALNKAIGAPESSHFMSVDVGSAALKTNVETTVSVKFRKTIIKSKTVSNKKISNLKDLFAEDGTAAVLYVNGSKLISFPKVQKPKVLEPKRFPLEAVSIRGELLKIGGVDESVPFEIKEHGTGLRVKGNTVSKNLARDMAKSLFNVVEVSGFGYWQKDEGSSKWGIHNFVVNSFVELNKVSSEQTFKTLRSKSDGTLRPFERLKDLRGED